MTDNLATVDQAAASLGFELEPFEGKQVTSSAIEIPGVAGGLRDAMKIEPREFHQGQRVYVLLECDVAKVRFEPVDTDELSGPQRRVQVLNTVGGTFLQPDVAKPAVDEQKERILRAREEATGVQRLPVDGTPTGGSDNGSEPITDGDGFVDPKVIQDALAGLDKKILRGLCDRNGIGYAKNATGAALIKKLVEGVPQLAEQVKEVQNAQGDPPAGDDSSGEDPGF